MKDDSSKKDRNKRISEDAPPKITKLENAKRKSYKEKFQGIENISNAAASGTSH